MARFGRADPCDEGRLSGVQRKSLGHRQLDANDPKATSAAPNDNALDVGSVYQNIRFAAKVLPADPGSRHAAARISWRSG